MGYACGAGKGRHEEQVASEVRGGAGGGSVGEGFDGVVEGRGDES